MTEREGQGARKLSFGLIAFAAFAAVCALGFGALGVWQVERLAWKNSLVAAVEERSTAAPLDLNQADWGAIDTGSSEYQRVSVSGRFEGRDTLSQAVTVYGGGFWVMTPLLLDDGRAVLVNRGFVTADQRDAGVERPVGAVTITGLLRASEPDGGFCGAMIPMPDAGIRATWRRSGRPVALRIWHRSSSMPMRAGRVIPLGADRPYILEQSPALCADLVRPDAAFAVRALLAAQGSVPALGLDHRQADLEEGAALGAEATLTLPPWRLMMS